jgi:hypothetical protein
MTQTRAVLLEHTAEVPVERPARAGSEVDVWVGPDGEATTTSLRRRTH